MKVHYWISRVAMALVCLPFFVGAFLVGAVLLDLSVPIPLGLTQEQTEEIALLAPQEEGTWHLEGEAWTTSLGGRLELRTQEYLSVTRENGAVWVWHYCVPTLRWQPKPSGWEPNPHPLTQA